MSTETCRKWLSAPNSRNSFSFLWTHFWYLSQDISHFLACSYLYPCLVCLIYKTVRSLRAGTPTDSSLDLLKCLLRIVLHTMAESLFNEGIGGFLCILPSWGLTLLKERLQYVPMLWSIFQIKLKENKKWTKGVSDGEGYTHAASDMFSPERVRVAKEYTSRG